MVTTHRSDLTTEIEKALTDEAYDGGSGPLSEAQFSAHVRRLAEAAVDVVNSMRDWTTAVEEAPAELAARPMCPECRDGNWPEDHEEGKHV